MSIFQKAKQKSLEILIRQIPKFMNKSWRTTAAGILAGLALIITQLLHLVDTDPNTVFSLELFLAGLGTLGLGWFSRDNGVSTEEARGK
jgi:hypothetical protein